MTNWFVPRDQELAPVKLDLTSLLSPHAGGLGPVKRLRTLASKSPRQSDQGRLLRSLLVETQPPSRHDASSNLLMKAHLEEQCV
eukprot:2059168-Amphidinium_carterae.1